MVVSVDGEEYDFSNIVSLVGNLEMKYKLFLEEVDFENIIRLLVVFVIKIKNCCLELIVFGFRLIRKYFYYL